jgi:hypothetical protein
VCVSDVTAAARESALRAAAGPAATWPLVRLLHAQLLILPLLFVQLPPKVSGCSYSRWSCSEPVDWAEAH